MTAAFCRSLEVMRIVGRKKGKLISFSHNIFLNEFLNIFQLTCGFHDVAN